VGFQALNRGLGADTIRLRSEIALKIDASARHGFEAYCWWWPEMVEELDCFLATSRAKQTLIDVGALHGLFSLAFVYGRRDVTAFAVEPGIASCAVIDRHMRMNGLNNISLIQAAVSDRSGDLDMVAQGPHLEAIPDGELPNDVDQVVRCPVTTLDRLCQELSIHPDLLKIDVEGYEFNVLRGAERVLREDRPTLFLEMHPAEMVRFGHTPLALVSLLAGLSYGFHDLRGHPIPSDRLESTWRWSHLVCEPH
jgi:FkbM family methyltransferase